MLSAGRLSSGSLFTQPHQDFITLLMADIDAYIEKYKDNYFRKTGVARAQELKKLILSQLIDQEELTKTQLMWRLYSYLKLNKGVGPLDTSTELRNVILNRLCKAVHVDENELDGTLTHLYRIEVDTMAAISMVGGAYHIDDNALHLRAKLLHIEYHLNLKPVKVNTESTEMKDILLAAIDGYRDEVNAHWYKRWFKQTGLKRANDLTNFINDQLVGKERLNDEQLCARIIELACMPSSEIAGIFGTSSDLRMAVMKAMCGWKDLNLNEAAINEEIMIKETPFTAPGAFIGHYPDPVEVFVEVRANHLTRAMHKAIPKRLAEPDPRETGYGI